MAGRGPQPKDPAKRARTNADPVAIRVLPAVLATQPELPESIRWPVRTLEWWQMWRDSPLSVGFTSTDWSELLDAALLHAKVWGEGDLKWLPELRLRTAKFGATPEDRARLRIQFAQADEADSKRPLTRGARDRFDGMRVSQDRPADALEA
jgi:hypothetical protein